MAGGSRVAVVAALLGNLLIALLKLGAGLLSRSAAMLAEAAHSFSDVGNQILLMVGLSRARKPATEDHPYGTGKAAYFWPFLVAILLFGVAGGYSLVEGVEKFFHPHDLGNPRIALAVLGVSFLIEVVSLTVALRQAARDARARGVASVREFLQENRDATLLTVVVEDTLALASLPLAAAALVASEATGDARWDALGSVVIGFLLMGFAAFLGWEVQSLLLGRGLTRRDREKVRRIVEAEKAFARLANFQSMYVGPDVVLLGVEVQPQPGLSAAEMSAAILRTEKALIGSIPALKYVYLEPTHPEGAPGTVETPAHAAHEPTESPK